jgi:hypothetical protein
MARIYINISLLYWYGGDKRGKKMMDTMPGGEQIILDKVPVASYCGACMAKMGQNGNCLTCPICHRTYPKEIGA